MRSERESLRAGENSPGACVLDKHELAQEQLYVAARIGRIDRTEFAERARRMERKHRECKYLSWLIERHPSIPTNPVASHDIIQKVYNIPHVHMHKMYNLVWWVSPNDTYNDVSDRIRNDISDHIGNDTTGLGVMDIAHHEYDTQHNVLNISRRDLRRARVTWRAKAMAKKICRESVNCTRN